MEFWSCGKSNICLIFKTKRRKYYRITVGKRECLTQILIGGIQEDNIQSRYDNRPN